MTTLETSDPVKAQNLLLLKLQALRLWVARADVRLLGILLVLSLVNGLAYVMVVPPWQHYDEANHFEYAWLVANKPGLPKEGDYDQEMRRAVASSMIEHGFFRGMGYRPDLSGESGPIWIGTYTQSDDPPLYYVLASLPLRLFSESPYQHIDAQLYAARLVSLLMYLATVVVSWAVARQLTPPSHALRWMLPLSIALLPAFADLMTAVNNDAGAVLAFSIFTWASLRLIRRGISLPGLVFLAASAGLCYLSKNTTWSAIPLAGLAVVLASARGKLQLPIYGLMAAACVGLVFAVFTWGDPILWSRGTLQGEPARAQVAGAPLGQYAFKINFQPDQRRAHNYNVQQQVPYDQISLLKGRTFTVGAWIWASRPIQVLTPEVIFYDTGQFLSQAVQVGQTPRFFAFTIHPDGKTDRVVVSLAPIVDPKEQPVTIYYDGVVVTEGEMPAGQVPVFSSEDASGGSWGSQQFTNLVRNGSAEQSGPWVRPGADRLGAKVLPDAGRLSTVLYTLEDLPASGSYLVYTAGSLFRSFWAVFGWGHVHLLGHKPYRVFLVVTLIAFAGLAIAFWKERRSLVWNICIFVFALLFAVWGQTFLRGTIYYFITKMIYVPVSRYAFPAAIPTLLALNWGWLAWAYLKPSQGLSMGFGPSFREKFSKGIQIAFVAVWVGLAVFALVSIRSFYFG